MRSAQRKSGLTWLWVVLATAGCSSERMGPGPCAAHGECIAAQDGGSPEQSAALPRAERGHPQLISSQVLRAHGGESGLVPVDARGASAYAAGHLVGAVALEPSALRAEVDGVPAQLPPVETVAQVLGQAGLSPAQPVVVYAQASDLAAARMVWTLSYMGQPQVYLLDGGFGGATGLATTTAVDEVPPVGSYPADQRVPELLVDTAWVESQLEATDVVFVDARTAQEFAAGHIPGALNFDWQGNVAQDGTLLPKAVLANRHAAIPKSATVVAYCQTGSRGSMAWFVLKYLGYPDVRLYDGSMAAWTQNPAHPIESAADE